MRADRLLAMLMVLQSHGKMTAQALAQKLEVSRRTILRDVEALSIAGVPIYAEGGHGGGIALDENYRVSLNGLREAEVRALFVSSNARLLRDIGLGEAAETSLPKLFAALPIIHQQAVEHIRQRILIDPVWWWHDEQPLPFWLELRRAIDEDRHIQATYEHYDGEVVRHEMEPYSLVAKASLWYLVAKRDGQFRTYRVSRFHDVVVLASRFDRQADFDLAMYWQSHVPQFVAALSYYEFTLRLDSKRVSFAKWFTPGRYQITEPPGDDGWLTAHFQVESLDVAKMFVFGLGTQAIIVEPPQLREAVLTLAESILNQYKRLEVLP